MRRRVYLFGCGILNWPGDSRDWNCRAVTWTHRFTEDRAEKFEYFCGPIDRAFGQSERAEHFGNLLMEYVNDDFNVVIVGHSNMGDVILKALKDRHWPRVEAVHLVSPACEANFSANGLNQALMSRRIGRVFVYRGGRDMPLRLAKTWPGRWLGYGTLGLTGPMCVYQPIRERIREIVRPTFGHSDWFTTRNFDSTMRRFTSPFIPGAEDE